MIVPLNNYLLKRSFSFCQIYPTTPINFVKGFCLTTTSDGRGEKAAEKQRESLYKNKKSPEITMNDILFPLDSQELERHLLAAFCIL